MVFQVYAILSRAAAGSASDHPPSYASVALAGVGTGALQTLVLSPVELVKIRLQVDAAAGHGPRHPEEGRPTSARTSTRGSACMRPAGEDESLGTMLVAGGLLPARRGQVQAAGAGADVVVEVPWCGPLLPEERPGGRAPRAVARPGHRRRSRHLLGVRAGAAVPGRHRKQRRLRTEPRLS
jgi:hypothetical protein